VTPAALLAKRIGERATQGSPCGRYLGLRLTRSDLEDEVEGGVLGEEDEQVVEHGQPGDRPRLAGAGDVHARVEPAGLVGLTCPSH
jgi:hypothetical protein